MNKKCTAILLALLVAAAEASNVANSVQTKLLKDERTWDGLGLHADVNDYVDKTIHMIVPFMREHGFDPMSLPDVEEGFEVRPVLITYSAWLRIHDGYMTGLVNVARSGDQRVNYFAKMLRVRVQLQFRNLEFVYKYLVKVMRIGPTGGIIGSLNRFVVIFDLLIDFNNDELHLQQFSLTDIGRLRVRLTGNILTDWLVNPVITVFTRIFDNIIIKVVEINIRNGIHDAIRIINSNIRNIMQYLESFGYNEIISF
ncbi:unnamed protein product [Chilo suppressalis]|uniref:Uncharacterized protein n=1 Tax=Chilo suppressalis TaxID=168631 RepID=A0ABN8B8L9_CHISP|nr:hypothetical protein evm_010589 [Chilo suppressalis]CAH0405953.1 unnamed protein product [Chilo suppressalis]